MSMPVLTDNGHSEEESDELVELLRRMLAQLQPGPERLATDWPNLTMQQLRVLRILYAEGPTRVSVLARRLRVSTPTVTGILDRLVRQRLAYRTDDPRDRRVVLNALTPEGEEVIASLHPLEEDRLRAAVATLDPATRRALANSLTSLLEGMTART
ncbi:transcriptional regulator, MarR family [Sphaerobacter thermophilus DSM 20745]|uniref:Transcriptional regulator, MarR family n=2 Tax=Sphaerobacter TaxID=2056 RepID=D1C5V1_SPHTD|nr:transcriptional regulator, MarR family [Sphaerobacter thermophilus DSM 20745]PZN63464.1 MAG: MarR family transcriptional regulator [Sphaerobacter thermophilus]